MVDPKAFNEKNVVNEIDELIRKIIGFPTKLIVFFKSNFQVYEINLMIIII